MRNGVLNIYKEAGFTSHDVVAKLRGITKQKKIGHTGTLDPAAEGVLPVCLGNATKLCDLLTDKDKTYEAVLLLGQETDTQDTTGQVLKTYPEETASLTEEAVREAVLSFFGSYDQIPPMYSALKVGGKKLYELAREGKEVERRARPVTISEISINWIRLPRVSFTVTCSKGTYIRTLCRDIGERLSCGGCMEKLLRTRVSTFVLEESLRLSQIEELEKEGRLTEVLIPVDTLFQTYPGLSMKPEGDRLVFNGNPFGAAFAVPYGQERVPLPVDGLCVRVYDSRGEFVGIYRYDGRRESYRPLKMFIQK